MIEFSRVAALGAALFIGTTQIAASQGVPRVVTDILPVHSLVSQVMEGVGEPDLLLSAGTDPHNHAMRPSQANMLESADLVIVIGHGLTPWLEKPLQSLSANATQIELLDVEGTTRLEYRGDHSHGHGHDEDVDPHAWLDMSNAQTWLPVIAEALAAKDPANGEVYRANADRAGAALSGLKSEWETTLVDVGAYGVHHDAFQYFESRFGLAPQFVIKEDDAHQPGPARIAELRSSIAENAIVCVFVEPLVNRGLVETVVEGSEAAILELDPMGVHFEPGPDLYTLVLGEIAKTMGQCR